MELPDAQARILIAEGWVERVLDKSAVDASESVSDRRLG